MEMPNSVGNLHGYANSLGNFTRGGGGAKFSRDFYTEMPNSLGNFAWGCQIPCLVGDTKNTEGVPKSLGDLTRGCRIPYDTG